MIYKIKNEWQLFRVALLYFTRLPVGKIANFSEEMLQKSLRYFPLVGLLVGIFGYCIFYLSQQYIHIYFAAVMYIVTTIIMTGALHEDGWADFCDGFGGGWSKEKILEIMKDSRLGTYGTLGLICILAIKFSIVIQFEGDFFLIAAILAHMLSRWSVVILGSFSRYARDNDLSGNAKQIPKNVGYFDCIFASVYCLVISWITVPKLFFVLFFALIVTNFLFKKYFEKWIDGYTGDCLGAVQQVNEILCYLIIFVGMKDSL